MKLGGLFSGIGGFELAWTQLGHEVAWMCERDPAARAVLAHHFPGVPIYEDVRTLDPAQVEPVDVVSGGSPCQGFSVAGQRTGLAHEESQLFADYVRITDGLAGRGLRWAVWENVPGLLSLRDENGERTFEHVVAALAGGTEPVWLDPNKRWGAGLAAGRNRAVAWRILDSRYFGVAQRRRRLFACVAYGGAAEDRAGRALLADRSGSSWDTAARLQRQARAAERLAGGAGTAGEGVGQYAFRHLRSNNYAGSSFLSPVAARDYKDPRDLIVAPRVWRKAARPTQADGYETWVDDGQANTLNVFDVGPSRATHAVVEEHGVRGLTPVEYERLQAFPDGWTEPAGSVSARYKTLGNAVTVSVVQWILDGVAAL